MIHNGKISAAKAKVFRLLDLEKYFFLVKISKNVFPLNIANITNKQQPDKHNWK